MNEIIKWIFIIFAAFLLIVMFQVIGLGLVILFLIIYLIYRLNKKDVINTNKNTILPEPIHNEPVLTQTTPAHKQSESNPVSPANSNNNIITFHTLGENISLFGYTIVDPLIYTSKNTSNDSSYPFVIYLTSKPDFSGNDSYELGYWPRFSRLTNLQKGMYIKWLVNGKKDPIDIGYVFIYYYGLEHRAFVEQKDQKVILFELIRLYNIYSENFSFSNYSGNFISYLILKIDNFTPDETDFLIQFITTLPRDYRNIPISDLLYKLTKGTYMLSQSVLPSILEKLFDSDYQLNLGKRQRELFTYYVEKEIEVLNLPELYTETDTSFTYNHASPYSFIVRPVQYKSLTPVSEIKATYQSCKGKWKRGFQNITIRKIDSSNDALTDVEKCAYLSSNLRFNGINPNKEFFDAKIQNNSVMEIRALQEFFAFPENEKLTLRQSEFLVDCCESLGYKIEPSAYLVKRVYKSTDKVILFTSTHKDNLKNNNFIIPSLWFDLGYKVALEDDFLEDGEVKLIQKTLKTNFKLSLMEKERLEKRGELYSITKQVNISGFADIIKSAEPESINLISTYLISVAAIDNTITIEEQKLLEKVFKQLSLPSESLTKCLNELQQDRDVVTIQFGSEKPKLGSIIPRPTEESYQSQEYKLDPAKLAFVFGDTAKGQKILEDIFAEESAGFMAIEKEELEETVIGVIETQEAEIPAIFLSQLIQKDVWSSEELKNIFKPYQLMLNNGVEMVNEWTDNMYDEYLLEEDCGIFRINKDFAEQLVELGVES